METPAGVEVPRKPINIRAYVGELKRIENRNRVRAEQRRLKETTQRHEQHRENVEALLADCRKALMKKRQHVVVRYPMDKNFEVAFEEMTGIKLQYIGHYSRNHAMLGFTLPK